ncbi:MAG: pseudouridine synthase, partial [Muribaculaceae bacterium]|nr:pseudouridine synthase [Muribaculaceae bacterium]
MEVVYEDNHIIIVNKAPGEIVQGDKTGDKPLSEIVKLWIKEKYNKPGNVFCGVTHRLDRPVGGLVIFAKTSKALSRMNEMFRDGKVADADFPERGYDFETTIGADFIDTVRQMAAAEQDKELDEDTVMMDAMDCGADD